LEDLKGVIVIGATNRPDIIDEALLRPGRFDRILEIPVPSREARKQILEIHLKKKPIDSTVNTEKLVEITDGYTGADIAAMVNAAAMSAIKEHISFEGKKKITGGKEPHSDQKDKQNNILTISMKHLETGLEKVSKKSKITGNSDIV